MNYRAEIDGLRALAVLPVILFHAGFEWFSGGFVGVDVFFVISGYLITTIIISEMAEGKFSIVNFYERRARRILPALFFVMAACLPFAWLWLTPNDLKNFGQSLVAVSTFSSNFLFWWESGYFDTVAEWKPLLHTWSLAVEEQYYILFPVFLMLTWRLGIKWVLILLSVLFLLSLGVAQWGAYNSPSATFFLLPTRGWELLVGVFAAFYLKYSTHIKSHTVNQALSLLGFGMIAYSIFAFDKTTPFPSFYALIPTVGTSLLILCAVPKTLIHKLLSLKIIVGIGLISYSAYLWHQPLLVFARHRLLGDVSEFILFILCVASLVMAWFSWRFIERPFRDRKAISRNFVFTFTITGMILFSLIGVYTNFKDGFLNRLSKEEQEIYFFTTNYNINSYYRSFTCYLARNQTANSLNEKCLNGTNLIWGDSHAAGLSFGMRSIDNFSQITSSGCPPIINQQIKNSPNCLDVNNRAIELIKKGLFKKIYLFSDWQRYDLKIISYLSDTIEELLLVDPNLQIKIVGGTPQWQPSLPVVLIKKGISLIENGNDETIINNQFSKVQKRDNEIVNLLYKYRKNNNIEFVSLLDKFCESDKCLFIAMYCGNKEPVVYDNGHFTAAGSKLAARLILNESDLVTSQCTDLL